MLDFQGLVLTWRPNQYLVAPPGFTPNAKPHRDSPLFPCDAVTLAARIKAHALRQPRTSLRQESPDGLALELVQRSAVFRFPDLISVRAIDAPGGARVAIYSRARYGVRDFGVNRARIEGWLAALAG
ncbi:MAG: DUF1499 domain-containing protein [Alphaproteobacteria bacterium]|nr:DUF1499 domain-containing protein [Alphaproteobacteria bacterium]